MKNKRFKNTVAKRNTHKRKSRASYINKLLEEINATGVRTDALSIRSGKEPAFSRGKFKSKRVEKLTRGVFSASKSGFGFVSGEDGYERDIFIPVNNTLGAIDGDLVEVCYHVYTDRFDAERTEGRVTKILEYGRKTVIGTVAYKKERINRHTRLLAYLIPDDNRVNIFPYISDLAGSAEGEKVELLLKRSRNQGSPEGDVIRRFGDTLTMQANYEAILAESEIPTEFSREELAEAEFFAGMPICDEGRIRREGEIIFTIDSESAKDLDDAVSLKKLRGGGWQLGVHIADVSTYVKERTHLDRAVMNRGTSVYFTDKVVPMLPKSLSNGACSLNPGEERYALSAIISLDAKGEIKSTRLEKSIIKSRIKGIYKEINSIFENRASSDVTAKYKPYIKTLLKMRELYLVLKEKSERRGSLELDGDECRIILDESGEVLDIFRTERGDSERMIEQFMLTANEAVARYLSELSVPCVYRIHENPPPEKLSEFAAFAQNLGLNVSGITGEKASGADFSALLSAARKRGIGAPVSYAMLRSMSKAKYSDKRSLHFGLSLDYYCHFTSPIRRLSDLATHRIIHKVIFEKKRGELYSSYVKRAASAASEAELRAITAERRIENLYKVMFMIKNIGKEYDAIITSVTSFGFFAELENTVEGLVPISELCGVFIYEERSMSLRSSKKIYRLGDAVRVRVEEVDVIRGKLRFSVV